MGIGPTVEDSLALIADYLAAFEVAHGPDKPVPHVTYSRGWFIISGQRPAPTERFRRSYFKAMIGNLRHMASKRSANANAA